MTRAQAAGPAPLMRSAPRPIPGLVPVGHHQQRAPRLLADALDGLEDSAHVVQVRAAGPGRGQIQRIEDDQGGRVGFEFGLDGGQLSAGARGGQPWHAEAQPEWLGQLVGVDALGGGDGLDAIFGRCMPLQAA
jgi:hypothetical protein